MKELTGTNIKVLSIFVHAHVCTCMCEYGHWFNLQLSLVTSCWPGYITPMPTQWINFFGGCPPVATYILYDAGSVVYIQKTIYKYVKSF